MDVNSEEQVNNLSPTKKVAYKLLIQATKDLIMGKCTDEEIAGTMSNFTAQSNAYRKEEDYVTIDKGMQILGMGKNRNDFCRLMKENGIVNEKFNTVHIGYNRHKIEALKYKKQSENTKSNKYYE